jgi:hypothetical protein
LSDEVFDLTRERWQSNRANRNGNDHGVSIGIIAENLKTIKAKFE